MLTRHLKPQKEVSSVAANAEPPTPHSQTKWTYDGERGPEHWVEIDEHYAPCATGHEQSPINIESSNTAIQQHQLKFNYRDTYEDITNNGHTVEMHFEPGSTLDCDNKNYELVQFHFHTPSEHRIHGESFPMEVHLVHQGER